MVLARSKTSTIPLLLNDTRFWIAKRHPPMLLFMPVLLNVRPKWIYGISERSIISRPEWFVHERRKREGEREKPKIILAFDARSTMFRGRRQREVGKRGKVGWMLSRGFSGEVSAHNGETSPRSREGIKGHYPRQ